MQNKNKTVRWGLIGLGWFGEVHAETLAAMPGIELAALCTRRPQRLAELAGRFGVGPSSFGALLDLGYRVDSSVTPGCALALRGRRHRLPRRAAGVVLRRCQVFPLARLQPAAGVPGYLHPASRIDKLLPHNWRAPLRPVPSACAHRGGRGGRRIKAHRRRR